uniref:Uncharacterized protein n=1 Tax=Cryptomonas curvata TaxID=233186 RepID=A0A7S0M0E0_9CRYP|mmetsp:Transcript_1769/g.3702  ORF Transcript_1769/g.3702 Transcript_1769/m.3702 type:complete len:499 (+) Transcript_1769:33-1529(+)
MTTHDFDPAKAIADGMLPITSVDISTFRMNLQAFYEHLEAVLEKMEDKLDAEDNEDHRRDQETERTVRSRIAGPWRSLCFSSLLQTNSSKIFPRAMEIWFSLYLKSSCSFNRLSGQISGPVSLSCTSGSDQLEEGTVITKALDEYKATANFLISKGYYHGAFGSVENCFEHDNTFMIVDSPSGSGKTLFGIALNQHFSKEELNTQVIHLIWPEAVCGQAVYDQLNTDYDRLVQSSIFFSYIRSLNFPEIRITGNRFETIWAATLKNLFPEGFDPDPFQTGGKRLLLFFDEMPLDPYSAGLMGKLRDLLKELKYVLLCLSGTNSKAANMVGQSQGSASSTVSNCSGSAWAVIITRLPSFDVDCPPIFKRWKSIEAKKELQHIVNCIRCSIVNGGNARSIAMAINCAEALNVEKFENAEECLDCWQIEFAKAVRRNKFDKTSYSETSKGLIGQLNMLLDASHDPDISNVLLSHHFAIRAIPDNGATISSKPNAKFEAGCF